jgi:transposase-like protein
MVLTPLACPTCHETDVVKYGQTSDGKQRFYGHNTLCTRQTFLQEYIYQGKIPEGKQQIVDMTMNGSGMRDIARVLHISPTTVIETLKKRHQQSRQCIMRSCPMHNLIYSMWSSRKLMQQKWRSCGALLRRRVSNVGGGMLEITRLVFYERMF